MYTGCTIQTELNEETDKQRFMKTKDVLRFRQHLLKTSLGTQLHYQHGVLRTRLQYVPEQRQQLEN